MRIPSPRREQAAGVQQHLVIAMRDMMHAHAAQHVPVRRAVEDMAAAAEADHRHPRRERRPRTGRRILDCEAGRGIYAQPVRGGEIDVGMRLAAGPAVGAVDVVSEMARESEAIERRGDIGGAARRSDSARQAAQRFEEFGRPRHRRETFGKTLLRPLAMPLAEIVRQRPPEPHDDPALGLLPIMPAIVAQAFFIGRWQPDGGQAFGKRPVRAHLAVGDDAVEIEDDGAIHGGVRSPPRPMVGKRGDGMRRDNIRSRPKPRRTRDPARSD